MILGIGSDVVEIERIAKLQERFGERFLEKVFTSDERRRALDSINGAASLAKRFAAKEAFLKALGSGFSQGVSWHEIMVTNDPQGAPYITLTGQALRLAENKVPSGHQLAIFLSLSDSQTVAHAVVVLEARPE